MKARRITRGMIAAAHRELETIRELGKEAFDNPNQCYQHRADAASRQTAVLRDAGQPLPACWCGTGATSGQWAGAGIFRASLPNPAVLITPPKSPPEIGGTAGLGGAGFRGPITSTFQD
jgi:hypothetical protein